jgi:hypothetical protein
LVFSTFCAAVCAVHIKGPALPSPKLLNQTSANYISIPLFLNGDLLVYSSSVYFGENWQSTSQPTQNNSFIFDSTQPYITVTSSDCQLCNTGKCTSFLSCPSTYYNYSSSTSISTNKSSTVSFNNVTGGWTTVNQTEVTDTVCISNSASGTNPLCLTKQKIESIDVFASSSVFYSFYAGTLGLSPVSAFLESLVLAYPTYLPILGLQLNLGSSKSSSNILIGAIDSLYPATSFTNHSVPAGAKMW